MDNDYQSPKNKLKLSSYVFRHKKEFWLQAAGGIIYNGLVVFVAIFLGRTIDAANLVANGEAELSLFYFNILCFVGLTALFQLARYFKRYYIRVVINHICFDMRAALMSSLFAMPMKELSHEKVGDMMSRMIGDVEQVGASVKTTITEMWDTVLLILSNFIACMTYSPKITLLASIPIPLVVVLVQAIRTPLYKLSQKARKAASNVNVHLQHNVSGIALLRLFGLESADRKRFSNLLDEQLKWNISASALQSGAAPLYILLATCGVILVVGMGGELVVNDHWTIGTFMAYLAMFTAMSTRTRVVGRVMNTWHGANASWDRICEKLQNELDSDVRPESTPQTAGSVPALDVRSLSFRYPFSEEPCLTDISFKVNKGEIIGITGPVGSGKSALAAALSGLYPYEGEVFAGGVPLFEEVAKHSGSIAYMDSEQFIFSDNVRFNVTLDRDGGDIADALSLADMFEDVEAFEDGIDTRLMERGVRISGGQRQRVSLARAWYGGSCILLLDDPFSAVDITMERRIMQNIRARLAGRAVICFSHRLSTFDMTDRVIVLEKGCISQSGSHDELLQQEGLYRSIYFAQQFMRGESLE